MYLLEHRLFDAITQAREDGSVPAPVANVCGSIALRHRATEWTKRGGIVLWCAHCHELWPCSDYRELLLAFGVRG